MKRVLLYGICWIAVMGAKLHASNLDSLLNELSQREEEAISEDLIPLYKALGAEFFRNFQYDEALDQYRKGLVLARALEHSDDEFFFLNHMGRVHFWKDDYTRAMEYYRKAQRIGEQAVGEKEQAQNLSFIAELYTSLGNYPQALETQFQALALSEKVNDSIGMALSLDNNGRIYHNQKRFDRALGDLKKALQIYEKLDRPVNEYNTLAAISSVHAEAEDYANALYYANRSHEIASKIGYQYGLAFSTGIMGVALGGQEDWRNSEAKLNEAIDFFKEAGIKYESADFSLQLAQVAYHQKKYRTSLRILDYVEEIADELDSKQLKMGLSLWRSRNYEKRRRTRQAFQAFQEYASWRDSLLNDEILKQSLGLERDYRIRQQDEKIERMEQDEQLTRRNFLLWGSLLAAGLLALILWLVLMRYRTLRQMSGLLSLKNEEIREQNERLAHSNIELRQFADLASNDLQEPLEEVRQELGQLSEISLTQDARQSLQHIRSQVEEMDTFLAGISLYSVVGSDESTHEQVDLGDLVGQATASLPEELQRRATRISCRDLPVIRANRRLIIQLFQHLIANAIKFGGEEDPEIYIRSQAEANGFLISIRDNGKGIPHEEQDQIFQLFYRRSEDENKSGTGIGLAICKKIVEQHGGQIWLESNADPRSPGQGTTFYVSLPG